ncbi:hypothetical protein Hrd1104_07535 [Halorhabdus sp. CBA1104]|uniref:DUF6602 domain-containing protein n=1 Tax=Halorhabdus sp. CBA1104 TaxID=1380432 RepID=UPI0012B22620|nr:DUF6602 domain-containing protein [Halorhabdus sp. CBA1104]QGN07163.1 hypothetical protein Hrd1104_07535 [Halorhabdus sp. CBA1104]
MAPFDEYFRAVSTELVDAYEAADGFEHQRDARAAFLETFLEAVYPTAYINEGGEIVDASGEQSNRAGIVLYDQHLPVLSVSGHDRYLSAGVHAHIDVKADLFGEIDHALSKVDSIKRLDTDRMPIDRDLEQRDHHFTAVVAYDGPDPDVFKAAVLKHYANRTGLSSCADLICVLGEYVMLTTYRGQDPGLTFLQTEQDSLMVGFVNLAGAVSTNYWRRRPLIAAYMNRTEAEQF